MPTAHTRYDKPQDADSFDANFAPKKPRLDPNQALRESARCLFCHDAPCVQACPTGIDIPLFIRQIHAGQPEAAAKTIYDSNWLGDACGQVCPTAELCEGACVHVHQDLPAVDIGRLQAYATEQVMDSASGEHLYQPGAPIPLKVAVIGGGPAGIAAACSLRRAGAEVELFEARESAGGLNRYGVAPYKYSNQDVQREIDWLQAQFGFTLHAEHPIQGREALEDLEARFDRIVLAVGLGPTRSLAMSGEALEGAYGAVEWIAALRNRRHRWVVPDRVIVLGGGNTAIDAAAEAARCGAHTTLVYRRSREAMKAYGFEVEGARKDGVHVLFHHQPVAILGTDRVRGVRFHRTTEENGQLVEHPELALELPAAAVIRATGQHPAGDWADWVPHLERDAQGCILTNADGQTGNPRYYAAGDAVNGGAEVVHAVAGAQKAAEALVRDCRAGA
jgi:glutamate synthase (NADPH/NADH) small chain